MKSVLQYILRRKRDYARLPSAKLVPLDLNALVNDVLDFARLGADKIELHPAEFEVEALLRSFWNAP